jgi:hypothetical protein
MDKFQKHNSFNQCPVLHFNHNILDPFLFICAKEFDASLQHRMVRSYIQWTSTICLALNDNKIKHISEMKADVK